MKFIQNIDNLILNFIQNNMHNHFLDKIMPMITHLGSAGAIWILIALIFISTKKHRHHGLVLIGSIILCFLVGNLGLKPLIARIRPCDVNTSIALLIHRPTDFSFPSGHAMSSFAAATAIFFANKRLGIAAFLLAILISFSRLYLYVHYPSDVVAGMIIGILLGLLANAISHMNRKNQDW